MPTPTIRETSLPWPSAQTCGCWCTPMMPGKKPAEAGGSTIRARSLPWPLLRDVSLLRKIYADDLLEEGQSLPILGGMRVIHTPGHTQGSISLYLEKHGVLITGDMLLNNRGRFAKPFPFPGTDPEAYRRSLERLSRLQFDMACVGHGKPVVGGASEKLRRMLDNYSWQSPWRRLARKLSPLR